LADQRHMAIFISRWQAMDLSGLSDPYVTIRINTPPQDPTVSLCLGTYGDPTEVGVSYERGTLVRPPMSRQAMDLSGLSDPYVTIRVGAEKWTIKDRKKDSRWKVSTPLQIVSLDPNPQTP